MYSANAYAIRPATEADNRTLRQLAELDSQRPLDGPVLIGEIRGRPAAAVSLTDGRVIADPFRNTGHLRRILHLRFDGFRAYSRTPSLSQRLRAGVRTVPVTSAATG
jgi:hypothetical protein